MEDPMTLEITHPTSRPAEIVDAAALRDLCDAEIHLPGEPGYDDARAPWAASVDQRPAAVAYPRSAEEVSALVRAAAVLGLRVAPQSTGHNAGPLAAQGLADVVLVRLGRLDEITVDAERRVVRAGAGLVWEPVVEAAAEAGFTVLHGSSPDVGIAGYSLGGGSGWYARKLGLCTNNLVAVELVDAQGRILRADAEHHPDLFWAVRGGGGSFGVVTALELRMFDFATTYGGMLFWDVAHTEDVLRTWAAWAVDAPDEVTTSFRVLRVPPLPEVPEIVRGRDIVVIDGAVLADDETARQILAPLRALEPEVDTFGRVPTRELIRLHMDPEGPTPVASSTAILHSLPESAIASVLEAVGPGADTAIDLFELRQLGGALGRPHPGGGATSHFEGTFLTLALGIAMTPERGARAHEEAHALTDTLAPFANGRNYLNFAENPVDVASFFSQDAWRRLTEVRATVDPSGLFVGNHPVPGAERESGS
ncbi:FAD-binding oxidoreductase [uncultured Phycicoccus sp.]|uniref:FAD-binding oxidoreductase n=1 Tax=uncultured Phycicoccus sp. TaxID=661422 RepID=UPI002614F382|nr:FAD-binding oxidoreductase [uncultured Phycicoccus sp.]